MGPLAAPVGDDPAVEGVAGELHQCIRQTLLAMPFVVLPAPPCERFQRGPDGGAADGVKNALKEESAILEAAHRELALLR